MCSDISLQFLNGRWSWTSYYRFICHLYILFSDMFFHVFCSFSGWIFSCFPFIFLHLQNSWYVLDTSLLSDMWLLNCFSWSSYCLSIFLTKSFLGKKFLILKFGLLIFAFIVLFLLLTLGTLYLFGCLFLYIVQACFTDSRYAFLWYKHFNVYIFLLVLL